MEVEFASQQLAKECADRGYSDARVAAELGVNQATVKNWFSGDRVPDGVNTLKLLILLKVGPKALLRPKEVVAEAV